MTDKATTDLAADPTEIWLAPLCHINDREWCEDDNWGTCDEPGCGEKSVRYIRADLVIRNSEKT